MGCSTTRTTIQEFKQKVMEEIEVDGERFFLDPKTYFYSDLVLISEEEFAGLSANIETVVW